MKQQRRFRSWLAALVLGGAGLCLASIPAAAQCIMCYASAAGSGGRGIRALQIGIFVLLVPTLTMLAAVVWITYRRRDSDAAGTEGLRKDSNWDEGLTPVAVSSGADGSAPRL
ncbi:MAG: hypothetical protein ACRD88_20630 [Terriglobia bacterium]